MRGRNSKKMTFAIICTAKLESQKVGGGWINGMVFQERLLCRHRNFRGTRHLLYVLRDEDSRQARLTGGDTQLGKKRGEVHLPGTKDAPYTISSRRVRPQGLRP